MPVLDIDAQTLSGGILGGAVFEGRCTVRWLIQVLRILGFCVSLTAGLVLGCTKVRVRRRGTSSVRITVTIGFVARAQQPKQFESEKR